MKMGDKIYPIFAILSRGSIYPFGQKIFLIIVTLFFTGWCGQGFAENVYLNILAVNGTEVAKEKQIHQFLPKELTAEDIVDAGGLDVDYDVSEGAYFVHGKVNLAPKETKTFKVLISDVWRMEQEDIENIRQQVDLSLKQLEDTEYFETGQIKKQSLLQRIDFLVQEQEKYADDIEKRIDSFRIYGPELKDIRNSATSIKYWRSKPPSLEEADIFYFIIELENTSDEKSQISKQRNYLPKEVKPEHFVDLQDFELRYDAAKGNSYLIKEEDLQPGETRRYSIGIIDVWNIKQTEIDNLKDRARYAYKFLEPTGYVENANYLMASIKKKLESIEESQALEKNINEHISVYRSNTKNFASAQKDVEALESLLEVVREDLKRSKVENVLQKIKGLQSVSDIAQNMLKKPEPSKAWTIIIVIVSFVGIYTLIHFSIWAMRSKNAPKEESTEEPKG